ncbi:hypothetical protein ACSTLD_23515, partial [Vibrio parahaemolyticus]
SPKPNQFDTFPNLELSTLLQFALPSVEQKVSEIEFPFPRLNINIEKLNKQPIKFIIKRISPKAP